MFERKGGRQKLVRCPAVQSVCPWFFTWLSAQGKEAKYLVWCRAATCSNNVNQANSIQPFDIICTSQLLHTKVNQDTMWCDPRLALFS